jgi:hypothetical protein
MFQRFKVFEHSEIIIVIVIIIAPSTTRGAVFSSLSLPFGNAQWVIVQSFKILIHPDMFSQRVCWTVAAHCMCHATEYDLCASRGSSSRDVDLLERIQRWHGCSCRRDWPEEEKGMGYREGTSEKGSSGRAGWGGGGNVAGVLSSHE